MSYNYDMNEMKGILKSLKLKNKKKKEVCNIGIEMYLFNEEDLRYIASADVSDRVASNYLHRKIMSM